MVGEDRVLRPHLVVDLERGGGELELPLRVAEVDLEVLVRLVDAAERALAPCVLPCGLALLTTSVGLPHPRGTAGPTAA